MKIISYSDLHLEFGTKIKPPKNSPADLMILAGDIITFKDFYPLERFLEEWSKPVIFVSGNHEYYTHKKMNESDEKFRIWLEKNFPNVIFLQNEETTIDGVHFFGGTMWTDFDSANINSMISAQHRMNDYRQIMTDEGPLLTPMATTKLHNKFVKNLKTWLQKDLKGKRVVITHHAPTNNPISKHDSDGILTPAFNSMDMIQIIEQYQPDLWIYGHTHECDDHYIGKTRIVSNQLGYPYKDGRFECERFDHEGLLIEL